MKIICAKSELLGGITKVSTAVSAKSTSDILTCILIDASSGEISLIGNDTELGIETVIDGEIAEPGVIAIDAKFFLEIVRKLPDSEVVIDCDRDFKTVITCESLVFNIQAKSGENFAYLPSFERNNAITVSQFSFKEAVRQTIFAVSDDNTNAVLKGENFEINGNNLRITALNGHLVAIRNIELKNDYPATNVIVPGKTLKEIIKVIPGNASDDIDIYLTDNHIIFEYATTTIVSRIITGDYIDVDRIVSYNYETDFKVNKKQLFDTLDRGLTLVREGDKKPVIFTVNDENLDIAINSQLGSMNDSLAINKTGKDITIGFNPRTFLEALKAIDEEEISIYLINSKVPCFIKDEDETFKYLVLPVNFV